MITLQRGPFELDLAPGTGGSVRAFRSQGRDLLRPARQPADPDHESPLEMAAYPLFPFAGRINHGRFEFDGVRVSLPPNFPPEPHAIHGQAWQAPWQVATVTATGARLRYEHLGDVWPWRYAAEQRFELDDGGLTLQLSLQNLSNRPMPAGLGWHPFFPRHGASLEADVNARWRFDPATLDASIEDLHADTDLRTRRAVADLTLDDVFRAGAGGTRMAWPDIELTLTASDVFGLLVVYVPRGRDFFCVEPISQLPNAHNSRHPRRVTGLQVLQPQAVLSGTIRLRAAESK